MLINTAFTTAHIADRIIYTLVIPYASPGSLPKHQETYTYPLKII